MQRLSAKPASCHHRNELDPPGCALRANNPHKPRFPGLGQRKIAPKIFRFTGLTKKQHKDHSHSTGHTALLKDHKCGKNSPAGFKSFKSIRIGPKVPKEFYFRDTKRYTNVTSNLDSLYSPKPTPHLTGVGTTSNHGLTSCKAQSNWKTTNKIKKFGQTCHGSRLKAGIQWQFQILSFTWLWNSALTFQSCTQFSAPGTALPCPNAARWHWNNP